MTTKYLDSKRIEGTAEDRAGYSAVSGGWKELARTTLGSSNSTIDVTGLADKRYYMVLYNMIDDGSNSQFVTNKLGNGSFDTGSNYAERGSSNGGSEALGTNSGYWNTSGGDQVCPELTVQYLANKSDKEKLEISHSCGAQADGAGTAPNRREHTGKWANTSNVIDRIRATTAYGGRTYGTDSEMVVLGWDPDDTHTTNFWEELASVELSSANATIDSGTITAKKYLWFQVYCAGSTASNRCHIRMNSLSTSIYSDRYSSDGGSDSTDINSGSARISNNNNTSPKFVNGFIVNNSSNEKLGIAHEVGANSAGAGSAPQRTESVFKIATNTQATSLQIVNISGNWSAGSILKVWGSN